MGRTDRVCPFTQMTPGAAATRARALTIGAPGRGDREAVHPPCLGHSVRLAANSEAFQIYLFVPRNGAAQRR